MQTLLLPWTRRLLQWCVAVVCCSGVLQKCVAEVCCSGVLQSCVTIVCCSSALQWCVALQENEDALASLDEEILAMVCFSSVLQ